MVYDFEESKDLHAVDWVIIALYFVSCIVVGLWVSVVVMMNYLCLEDWHGACVRGYSTSQLPAWIMLISTFMKSVRNTVVLNIDYSVQF